MMQPGAIGQDVSGTVVKKKGGGLAKDEVVNEERFWKKREEDVPVDQVSALVLSLMGPGF